MAHQEQDDERLTFHFMDVEQQHEAFARDVAQGLAAPQKTLPAKYFYDARGSLLYEQICTLPEYYPYRAERDILATYATEMYTAMGHVPLVEFGSGNAAKTRYLLTAYEHTGRPFLYCPVDISRAALEESTQKLLAEYPHLSIRAMQADFAGHPDVIRALHLDKKAIAFFGSNLGNFTREESLDFLRGIAVMMELKDVLLLGIDLKKSPTLLLPAYDDAQGVTAAFNLNLLSRMNHELGANFNVQSFAHLALYNQEHGRVEMHLRSRYAQQVTIAETAQTIHFAAGETIHTENSYKYSIEDIRTLGQCAGLTLSRTWFDQQHYFVLGLFRRAEN
jgi:L-histidine N-alpha-methyltransferase